MKPRTASVLLTSAEVDSIRIGRRILYRQISVHWDGQFNKFKGPLQPTLDGTSLPDVVHLMRELDRTIVDKHDRERRAIVKVESRILVEISDEAEFPEGFVIETDRIRPGEKCWALILGDKVEV